MVRDRPRRVAKDRDTTIQFSDSIVARVARAHSGKLMPRTKFASPCSDTKGRRLERISYLLLATARRKGRFRKISSVVWRRQREKSDRWSVTFLPQFG